MIYVRVELRPSSGGPSKVLGELRIVNDGTGDETLGRYDVTVFDERYPEKPFRKRCDHFRDDSVWTLLRNALWRLP